MPPTGRQPQAMSGRHLVRGPRDVLDAREVAGLPVDEEEAEEPADRAGVEAIRLRLCHHGELLDRLMALTGRLQGHAVQGPRQTILVAPVGWHVVDDRLQRGERPLRVDLDRQECAVPHQIHFRASDRPRGFWNVAARELLLDHAHDLHQPRRAPTQVRHPALSPGAAAGGSGSSPPGGAPATGQPPASPRGRTRAGFRARPARPPYRPPRRQASARSPRRPAPAASNHAAARAWRLARVCGVSSRSRRLSSASRKRGWNSSQSPP